MQIEEGGTYRAANGDKIGPMINFDSTYYPGSFIWKPGDGFIWSAEGECVNSPPAQKPNASFDIVALWGADSPIRTETVTTRRIEPGVYGRLSVRGVSPYPFGPEGPQMDIGLTTRGDDTVSTGYVLTAPELRELARVALELAEYLENA